MNGREALSGKPRRAGKGERDGVNQHAVYDMYEKVRDVVDGRVEPAGGIVQRKCKIGQVSRSVRRPETLKAVGAAVIDYVKVVVELERGRESI